MEACGRQNPAVHCYKALALTLRSKGRCAIKPRSAPELGRVCRAWHLTSEVQVLVPGIRRAEG